MPNLQRRQGDVQQPLWHLAMASSRAHGRLVFHFFWQPTCTCDGFGDHSQRIMIAGGCSQFSRYWILASQSVGQSVRSASQPVSQPHEPEWPPASSRFHCTRFWLTCGTFRQAGRMPSPAGSQFPSRCCFEMQMCSLELLQRGRTGRLCLYLWYWMGVTLPISGVGSSVGPS